MNWRIGGFVFLMSQTGYRCCISVPLRTKFCPIGFEKRPNTFSFYRRKKSAIGTSDFYIVFLEIWIQQPKKEHIILFSQCKKRKTDKRLLTLFLPGEGGISPLIVYHVTTSVRNRVKSFNGAARDWSYMYNKFSWKLLWYWIKVKKIESLQNVATASGWLPTTALVKTCN